jgi:hypothetical protein
MAGTNLAMTPNSVEGSAATPKLKKAEANRAPKTRYRCEAKLKGMVGERFNSDASPLPRRPRFRHCTVIGLATRGIMMIESCRVNEPTENQIPVAWNG